ncbi:MAG TPA: OmpA family protein [Flavobacterium sp.]|nr:OmpA family protein [Flavobacterium sp.]
MIKRIIVAGLILITTSSCVSRRLYNELNDKYQQSNQQLDLIQSEYDQLVAQNTDLEKNSTELNDLFKQVSQERDELQSKYKQLEKNYKDLESTSAEAIQSEIERLDHLKGTLDERTQRVNELEGKLSAMNQGLDRLKESLSDALYSFEGKGLTVEQKDGKVYVSMENKLLFPSGSWTVSAQGRNAVEELAKVLANNPDISILIEGHTDSDRITGNLGGGISNNWDLSTKRATAIVNILEENPSIVRKNLTAAGRSEYAPIASNNTTEGKAKNRRIEVVLTPNLDEINKLLSEL